MRIDFSCIRKHVFPRSKHKTGLRLSTWTKLNKTAHQLVGYVRLQSATNCIWIYKLPALFQPVPLTRLPAMFSCDGLTAATNHRPGKNKKGALSRCIHVLFVKPCTIGLSRKSNSLPSVMIWVALNFKIQTLFLLVLCTCSFSPSEFSR